MGRPQLSEGDVGEGVSLMQGALNAIFDILEEPSGVFDSETAFAVSQIQSDNGLDATGVVDDVTWGLIDALLGPAPSEEVEISYDEVPALARILTSDSGFGVDADTYLADLGVSEV